MVEVNLVCYGNVVVGSSRQSYNMGEIIELGIWRECSLCFLLKMHSLKEDDTYFFHYGFCKRIWMENSRKCSIDDPPNEWENIIEKGVKRMEREGLKDVLCRLCFSASLYNILKERGTISDMENQVQTEEKIAQKIR